MSIINIGKYIMPLAVGDIKTNTIKSFAGTSFILTSKGHIITCRHIVDNLDDNEILFAKNFGDNTFYELLNIKIHDDVDLAIAETNILHHEIFEPFTGEVLPTFDVMAFGYTLVGFDDKGNISLDNRVFKGNIVRVALELGNLPSRGEILELSFPSLSGFSGAPIIFDYKVIGMLFDNLESEIISHSHTEIDENGQKYIENTSRIIELGIGHSINTIIECCEELGIHAFK